MIALVCPRDCRFEPSTAIDCRRPATDNPSTAIRHRYARARTEHVSRLHERADRHNHADWLNQRLRSAPASAEAADVADAPADDSKSRWLRAAAHSVRDDEAEGEEEDELSDDPALLTSEAYRRLYTVSRRLKRPIEDVISLGLERGENVRMQKDAEMRVRQLRGAQDLLRARLARVRT